MWSDLVAWFQSPGGARVLQTAIVPAVAILVAGVLAALIGRAAVRAAITRADRVEAAGAVAGLVEAARAATEPDQERGARRRAVRLRTEADVRTRLLPLPGAGAAADWAAARTDALQQASADGPVTTELDELRDRLVAWVDRPGRAKRIFTAAPVAASAAKEQKDRTSRRRSTAVEAPAAPVEQPAETERPAAVRTDAQPERPAAVRADAVPSTTGAVPSPARAEAAAAAAAAAGLSAEGIPAWQRTRSGERLQQERATRGRAVESPTDDVEPVDETHTAPVQLQHPHRSEEAAAADAEEAIRLEAHQQARHARPAAEQGSAPAATGAVPAPGGAPARAAVPAPAWLDVYDDEAQVTQNMDLKTPPPVAASAVRDRGAPGEDLVPRS